MSLAPALVLRAGDRDRLADLARLPSVPSGLARRARMVLLAVDGMPNAQVAQTVGVSRPTVIGWRDYFCKALVERAIRARCRQAGSDVKWSGTMALP
jgi:hypothetical protein